MRVLVASSLVASSAFAACTLKEAFSGSLTCDAAQPEWVARYSAPSASAPVEQVHLNVGRRVGEMVVGWATAADSDSLVEFGLSPDALTSSVRGGKAVTCASRGDRALRSARGAALLREQRLLARAVAAVGAAVGAFHRRPPLPHPRLPRRHVRQLHVAVPQPRDHGGPRAQHALLLPREHER